MKQCPHCKIKYLWFHDEALCKQERRLSKKRKNCKHEFHKDLRTRCQLGEYFIEYYECKKCGYRDEIRKVENDY